MPTVRMIKQISGTRNGDLWPAVGDTIEVPDHEADQLVHTNLAELVEPAKPARKAASK